MSQRARNAGFTLLELMVAMAVFLIIGGITLGLFAEHVPLFNRQQDQASLNIQIRNSIMQLQTDVVNGGSGYVTGTDLSPGVLGVTITNSNPTTACNTASTYTYSSTCFDTLNIINVDSSVSVAHPDSGQFSTNYASTDIDCISTNTNTIYIYPPAGVTAATLLTEYKNAYNNSAEKELLLVNDTGTKMTTITLTAAPSATVVKNGVTAIQLSYNFTNSSGFNSASNDPLNIAAIQPNGSANGNPMVSAGNYCSMDYVLELAPITYSVSTSIASDPELMRTQGGVSTVLAQQVIGFKVGAMLWDVLTSCTGDPTMATDSPTYCYDSANDALGGYASQWNKVRSIQISLIGRTNPDGGASYTYRNGFDNGPYQIEGVNAVINPRNMSMNDADF
jgi:prepilin-type N-terminal cleavage/methylation domain-containing protein